MRRNGRPLLIAAALAALLVVTSTPTYATTMTAGTSWLNAPNAGGKPRATRTYSHQANGVHGVTPKTNYSPDIACTDSALYFAKTSSTTVEADKGDGCNGAMASIQISLQLWWWCASCNPADWQIIASGSPSQCYSCASLLTQLSNAGMSPGEYRATAQFTESAPPGYVPSGYVSQPEYAYVDLP